METTHTLHKPRKTFDMICSSGRKVFAILFWIVACVAASPEHLFVRVGKLDRVLGAELFLTYVFADHTVEECFLWMGRK
jgi:hypothetical protein